MKYLFNTNFKKTYKSGALFLDFDGTLSPIVRNPVRARLAPGMKPLLKHFAQHRRWCVVIVSGRELKFIQKKVDLKNVLYVGNHGYEIKIPKVKRWVHPGAKKTHPIIARLCRTLKNNLKHIPGVFIENKGWSGSVHIRRADPRREPDVKKIMAATIRSDLEKKRIKTTTGKKVFEIRPPGHWNKGQAVKYLLKKFKGVEFPVYVGDDKTDEDAFKVIPSRGYSIRVGHARGSNATHYIRNVREMKKLLELFKGLMA